MSNKKYENISLEQSEAVFDFLTHLFSDDVEGYWKTISKVDQARVYGMFLSAKENNTIDRNLTFFDFVRDNFKLKQEEIYQMVKENPGVSSHLRYSENGEALIYVLKDVKVPRTYIAESPEWVLPVVLAVDTDINNGELQARWKVRIYRDQNYKFLNPNT